MNLMKKNTQTAKKIDGDSSAPDKKPVNKTLEQLMNKKKKPPVIDTEDKPDEDPANGT